jgi:polyhydroxybutyrate depolymerase
MAAPAPHDVRPARVGCARALLLATALVLAAAGCSSSARDPAPTSTSSTTVNRAAMPVPAGSSVHSITVDGRTRTFLLYRPASLPTSHAVPLVVMIHGGYGSARDAEADYGWNAQARAGGFVVAYPAGWHRAWNAGGLCCGMPASSGVDDVKFLSQLVSNVRSALPIDPARIYAAGISNGGIMAYRLACETTLFAAIGVTAATQLGPCPHPRALSVIHVHGLADRLVPFAGPGAATPDAAVDGLPVPQVVAGWRSVDRCAPPSSTSDGIVTTSVSPCPNGRAVELVTVAGAGHQWPGARPGATEADPPSLSLDATAVIWAFFESHPRR